MPIGFTIASVKQAIDISGKDFEHDRDDKQLASNLSHAADLIQSDSNKNAKSFASSMLSSRASNSVGNWLAPFGTGQLNLGLEQDLKRIYASLDMLIPLYDTQQILYFSQIGKRNNDSRNTVNISTGVRIFTDHNWMFGGNFFVDDDLSGHNHRVAFGGEVWKDYLKI